MRQPQTHCPESKLTAACKVVELRLSYRSVDQE